MNKITMKLLSLGTKEMAMTNYLLSSAKKEWSLSPVKDAEDIAATQDNTKKDILELQTKRLTPMSLEPYHQAEVTIQKTTTPSAATRNLTLVMEM